MTTPVTDHDIREVAESLQQVEDLWNKVASLTDPRIPCPECGGTGTLAGGGSLGEIPCDTCDGQRYVDHPAAQEIGKLMLPDFGGLQNRLRLLCDSHDEAARRAYLGLKEGGDGRFTSPVSREDLEALRKDIAAVREQGRQVAIEQAKAQGHQLAGPRRAPLPLPKPKDPRYGSLGDGGTTVDLVDLDDKDES